MSPDTPSSPLRLLREKAGLTQGELARRSGIHQRYISEAERDLYNLKPAQWTAIRAVLDQALPTVTPEPAT